MLFFENLKNNFYHMYHYTCTCVVHVPCTYTYMYMYMYVQVCVSFFYLNCSELFTLHTRLLFSISHVCRRSTRKTSAVARHQNRRCFFVPRLARRQRQKPRVARSNPTTTTGHSRRRRRSRRESSRQTVPPRCPSQ